MQSKLSRIALAAAAGAMVTVSVAGTATAAGSAWEAKGRVTANGGLFVRARPDTGSRVVGWHAQGSIVSIKCKENGGNVHGNRLWYQLSDHTFGWSSARYIQNLGRSPEWCAR
ncbi:SH3 domain-containing protein [Streptomyces sp. SL13]|uniref:SH3 domain-containing protein n=1 Tax=Streptantibioticus silvisoli TaxID=2705255 RepID=A0AA90KGF7_9ACTN|nr:SH3 domain-containing protein [Streptantibioticus silvisoli]MDI5961945.1 SH3 domain-containing protein [Streptantibioticus silvisoli]MDI5970515.1 SH3 domain-containing protein [Streptantibioticus silvisoli]